MRSNISIEFRDLTNYDTFSNEDIVGIVMDHYWGEDNTLTRYNVSDFNRMFPTFPNSRSYINALRSFRAGASTMEIVRVSEHGKYFAIGYKIGIASTSTDSIETDNLNTELGSGGYDFLLSLKYKGVPSQIFNADWSRVSIKIVSADEQVQKPSGATEKIKKIQLTMTAYLPDGSNQVVEFHEGSLRQGDNLDGRNFFLGDVLDSDSDFLKVTIADDVSDKLNSLGNTFVMNLTNDLIAVGDYVHDPAEIITLADAYNNNFDSVSQSLATILIPSFGDLELNQTVMNLATNRSDCMSITALPTSEAYTKANIKTYFNTLPKTQFSMFYAMREIVNISGRNVVSDGLGTIAGSFARVAAAVSANQVPSAETYGSIPAVLQETLRENDVLELSKEGMNLAYMTNSGARLWGIRTMHARKNSYYAKSNVMRVVTRILKPALAQAIGLIHQGNTVALRAGVQTSRQSQLNELIGQGALRPESIVICNNDNNEDIDTRGGEILVIDFELWFVKLVEQVKFRITATDNSVTATLL